ncbi:MAG TPA: response regulator [Gemmatimonadales bacterium]|nr:response regulator [Gemmatimonadales bacterium]
MLLVDDQALHRQLIERQLQRGGYRVIATASGRDALAILTEQATSIDLLLTDIMMPRMIGPQPVAIVQIRWPAVRALCMTGGAEEWALQLMRDAKLQCLEKPFTEVQLRDALAAALSNPDVTEN